MNKKIARNPMRTPVWIGRIAPALVPALARIKKTARSIVRRQALTPFELVTLAVSICGLLSLLFIIQQVRLANAQVEAAKEQTQLQRTQSVMDQMLELDKLFIEHPDLRPYFYEGQEIRQGDQDELNGGQEVKGERETPVAFKKRYQRVLAIADFQLDFFDLFLNQSESLILSQEDKENWLSYITDSFAKSPVMCQRLNSVKSWYSIEMYEISKCR
jgi:hypothetical protein